MKQFLVLFREPDGRTELHNEEEIKTHQANWKKWLETNGAHLAGGKGLTLNGKLIGADRNITTGIHQVGQEIVGGFLLLNANDLDHAAQITASCPVFEFGGIAEVRELQ